MAAFGSSNIAPSYHQAFAGAVPFAQKCQCGLALRLAHHPLNGDFSFTSSRKPP